jgi:ribosomal protein S20
MEIIRSIQNRIYEIRGERVMLDSDLAALYESETKLLNKAVKRNIKRFPKDFMFQLSNDEFEELRFQIETSKMSTNSMNPKNVISKNRGGRTYLPYVFTEHGVSMLSAVLNSDVAINMNIAIMRAFVELRRVLTRDNDIREQLKTIKERIGVHDAQLNQVFDAMENLLDENAAKRKWFDRDRIGYKA